eukprot:scaffold63_cov306-Pinguiococcus_pyrenoidosus.AAC.41
MAPPQAREVELPQDFQRPFWMIAMVINCREGSLGEPLGYSALDVRYEVEARNPRSGIDKSVSVMNRGAVVWVVAA